MQIALTTLPSFAEADINTLAMETTRLQVAGIETFSSNTVDKAKECMAVASTESMVDTTVDKVIEKLRNIFFHTSTDKNGGNDSANFVGYQMRGGKGRGRGNFHHQRKGNPRNPGSFQSERKCRACESADHFYQQCPFVSVKPAVTKTTMHGIRLAPSTND